ncbi:MAG: tRNA (guanine37-N1)-methyltransferase [Desulforhopalus sp.]
MQSTVLSKRRGWCGNTSLWRFFVEIKDPFVTIMSAKLKQILSSVLPKKELERVIGSYDVVGDIAIVIIPEELVYRQRLIGEALLTCKKNVRVVAKRVGNYTGEFRTIELEVIAGEQRKETEVTEFGVRFLVDVEKTYFSVRSGNERRRIASLVQPLESVLVMFSGVGPYPLLIAKHSAAKNVIGVEKNPLAHGYAVKNLHLNKKIKNVQFHLGDAADLPALLTERFSRIVMPLPTMAETFLPAAIEMLGVEKGWIHYYEMAHVGCFDRAVSKVQKACDTMGKKRGATTITRCGHCGPKTHRICVDAQIF